MTHKIDAIYENGLLRPLAKLDLPEHIKVHIAIMIDDDWPSMDIAKLAEAGKSFDFWNNPDEDIYNIDDGKEVK